MAEMGNWKDILKAQNEDLARLETMDTELNAQKNSGAFVARRPSLGVESLLARKKAAPGSNTGSPSSSPLPATAFTSHQASTAPPPHGEHYSFGDIYGGDGDGHQQECTGAHVEEPEPSASPVQQDASKAPDTTDRYIKAKVKLQTQQLQAANELKLRMEEETRDLQRQLKQERENSKQQKNRIQQLEIELKRQLNTKKTNGVPRGESVEDYRSEIASLKRDVETAQRIAKNAEAGSKTKDIQLKRASESIARMKTQLEELNLQKQSGSSVDKEKVDQAEARIKVLEKQRTELMEGFRKQMKLIDVLKRQKVHMEAARLLAFTEEEFMKTLEWKV